MKYGALTSFFVMLLMAYCSPRVEESGHSFRIYEEDGITISESSGGPKYTEPLFSYEEVLRLNQDPSVTESLLYRPEKFTRGPDGNYYVFDRGNHRIAVFDEGGTYRRSFGGEGEGPGTFRSMSFQCLHDGILYIHDFQLNRTTLMRLDGSLVEVLIRPRTADQARRYRLVNGWQLMLTRPTDFGENYDYQRVAATIVDADLDTIAQVATDPVEFSIATVIPDTRAIRHTPIQFCGFPCSDYSPEPGIQLSDGQTPVIYRYNENGILIGKVMLGLPPVPVPREEREWLISDLDRRIREADGERKEQLKLYRELLTIADQKGYWTEMVIDDAGFTWLNVIENQFHYMEDNGGTICDVISPGGEYLGRTRLPGGFGVCVVSEGYVCAIQYESETGEYFPTVYRIRPAVGGLEYPRPAGGS